MVVEEGNETKQKIQTKISAKQISNKTGILQATFIH